VELPAETWETLGTSITVQGHASFFSPGAQMAGPVTLRKGALFGDAGELLSPGHRPCAKKLFSRAFVFRRAAVFLGMGGCALRFIRLGEIRPVVTPQFFTSFRPRLAHGPVKQMTSDTVSNLAALFRVQLRPAFPEQLPFLFFFGGMSGRIPQLALRKANTAAACSELSQIGCWAFS